MESRILATWITFTSCGFSCLYWLKQDVQRYYPRCFKNFANVTEILEFTRSILEKPNIAKAQSKNYSCYKSQNTWKICLFVYSLAQFHLY